MTDDAAPHSVDLDLERDRSVRRVLILGANGPTGRLVVQQALNRGLEVRALTRNPDTFPVQHGALVVIGGDATDPAIAPDAVHGCDAVISVIGAAYTRKPVSVYSRSATLMVEAMVRARISRLLVVTSAEVDPTSALQGTFVTDRIVYPLLRHVIGRTVYDDMARMETVVRDSTLAWTIVRPPGLTSETGDGYAAAETRIQGTYCARNDLAAFLLDQLHDPRFVRRVAAVSSPGMRVAALRTLQREVLKKGQ